MRSLVLAALGVSLTTTNFVRAALSSCPDTSQADVDYIVVGAGAGGGPLAARLAESGFSVMVVDAGHDVSNVNATIPLYFGRACDDLQLELNYTYNEYPPGFQVQRDDQWYPRARGIGGSTIHNALINMIAGTGADFNGLSTMFADPTWSRENMQNYFKRIEKNLYLLLPLLHPDHGFDGWLSTSLNPALDLLNPKLVDLQIVDVTATLEISGVPILDLNNLPGDNAAGSAGLTTSSFTIDKNHNRSSVYQRLIGVRQSSQGRLQFSLDTLATKILMCNSSSGVPTAYGVEVAPGAGLAVASNFNGKSELKTKNITARREVIVSAGVFQSPQLLMLSGIGDREQLGNFGIDSVVHLPGVGMNMQDHDEIATIWRLKQNFSLFNDCTFLSDPSQDPCLEFWRDSGHLNLYSFGSNLAVIINKSVPSMPVPDIMSYWAPGFFPGFVRGFAQEIADNHNTLTSVVLKAHPSSKGTVRLTGSHPQDKLDIQKQHFQAEGGRDDLVALREGIKAARRVVEQPLIALHVDTEVFPGPQAQTDEEIEDHVLQNVFGHHACCTNAIGSDDDENAVLDGDFRVRGVANLRVVDTSSWPNVPGFFITTPTYMISEKAADVIIAAARKSSN